MFNRSKASPVPVVPIDEDEQEKIANELKQQATGQTSTIRTIFQYIFMIVVLILFICLLYSVFSPWEMEHQKVFLDIVPVYGFFSHYVGSMYCYAICAFIVKTDNQRVNSILLNAAYLISVMSLIAWGIVFNTYGVTNPLLYWLPLSNLAGIVLAHYVDRDTRDLVASVEGLNQYKYSFKGV